jgi:tRNA pseudouridine38/39 synthase
MKITFEPVFGVGAASHPLLNMYVCTVRGSAFLWHQIRYTMEIFFLIGNGKEEPEIIDYLFDVKNVPDKPLYNMASDKPLILSN